MSDKRREDLLQKIQEAHDLLSELESSQLYSSDPQEKGRLRRQIAQTKTQIAEYEAELRELEAKEAKPKSADSARKMASCPKPPSPPEKFAGRDTEIAELSSRLRNGQTTAITAVDGLGGIGKTTLAKKVANELFADKTFRAVLWADINRNPDLVTILDGWLKFVDPQLTLPVATPQQQALFARSKLEEAIAASCEDCQNNRTLVVLDDVWADGLPIVRLLKDACPAEATILLTTRSYKVATNLGADSSQLKKLSGAAAIEMLKLYLDFAEPNQLEELAKLLGGHPLAMTLAAKRVLGKRTNLARALKQQIAEYQRNLKNTTVFKDLKLAQGEQRDDNLELVLSFSYAELSETNQQRFRALGILAHDEIFDSNILKAIWQIDEGELIDVCDSFCQLSLLDRIEQPEDEADAPQWFGLHPLLQAYARALLHQLPAEHAEVAIRYHNHVIEITELFYALPLEKWGQITPYLPQVHQVGNALVRQYEQNEQQDEEFLGRAQLFAINTNNYLYYRREVQQDDCQTKWPEMGLAVSRQLDDKRNIGFFLMSIGQRLNAYGQKQAALDYYNQSLEIRRELGDVRNEATTLHNIGSVYDDLGDKIKALDYYLQALPLSKQVGDIGGEAITLNNIGGAYDDLGDKDKALDYYQQALPLRKQVGDKSGEAVTCHNIGWMYYELGQLETAIEYLAHCVDLMKQVQHPYLEQDRQLLEQWQAELEANKKPS